MPPYPPSPSPAPQPPPSSPPTPSSSPCAPTSTPSTPKDYAALPAFHNPSFTFVSATGKTSTGSVAAVAAMTSDLALPLFEDFYYEVVACTGVPTGETTFRFVAVGRLFVDLPGEGKGKGEVDGEGRGWDCLGEGAWVFDCVEEGGRVGGGV